MAKTPIEAKPFDVPGIEILFQTKLSDNRAIEFRTGIDQTADKGSLREMFDLMNDTVAREQARVDLAEAELALPAARQKITIAEQQIEKQRRLQASVQAGFLAKHQLSRRQGEWQANEQQSAQLAGIQQTTATFEADIPIHRSQVEYLEKKIARLKLLIEEPANDDGRPLRDAAE